MSRIKWGFGILGIILVAALYYFNHTENIKNLDTLKHSLNLQLNLMQTNGFTVSNRDQKKETEHFVIQINDPKKASVFLKGKGIQITAQEVEDLIGVQVSTDVTYLQDTISLELYPLTVPSSLTDAVATKDDRRILAQIKEMIKKKAFLMHVDIVHSSTTFTGYIKDINEKAEGEKEVKLALKGLQFSGKIKEEKIIQYMQRFDTLHLYISNMINRTISGYQSNYALTGTTAYDYTTDYSIDKMQIKEEAEGAFFADTLVMHSASSAKDNLVTETLKAKFKNLDLLFEKEKFGMHMLELDMNISNINIETLDKLQKSTSGEGEGVDMHSKTPASNNIHLDIVNLSVEKVTLKGKKMNGFNLDARLDIDETLDIYRLGMKPKNALKKMEGDIHVSLSKEILELLKEDPKFMLTYMMYRPKRELEQRIYNVHIKDGAVKINNKLVEF